MGITWTRVERRASEQKAGEVALWRDERARSRAAQALDTSPMEVSQPLAAARLWQRCECARLGALAEQCACAEEGGRLSASAQARAHY